ncbi:MAG: DUF4126 domain-containing protein [Dermatophilaceae bacterium]|nr:DUF4126 domain-containing protein [Actinomycetales bacterium]MBP8880497.1 DUF4126 domain-containing protein [Dermatophilaceae bacterium]MBP9917886.1 DUF4126 domain-containing protein [Dermatophilaceae bacterium]
MGAEVLPWVFTSGWASGINAYAVVLIMGLAERIFNVTGIPDALARTDVLIGAGVLFVIEMVADKIPYLDSTWDSIHTVVRPAVGATLGYLFGHESSDLNAAFMAATGGFTALASHLVKAGTRAAVNTSPEPASNIVVSTAEDVTVAAVVTTAFANPWVAAGIAGVLLVVGAALVIFLLKRIRRFKARYDSWGERLASTPPSAADELREAPPSRSGDTRQLPTRSADRTQPLRQTDGGDPSA